MGYSNLLSDEFRDDQNIPLDRYLILLGFRPWRISSRDRLEDDSTTGNCFIAEMFGQSFFVIMNESNFSVLCQPYDCTILCESKRVETEREVKLLLADWGFSNPDMFTSLD